jgi:hypothetical protein
LFRRKDYSGIYRNVNGSASAFHTPLLASVIHQHVAHHLGSCSEKMSAISPTRIGARQKSKERLLHQRGGLHGVVFAFAPEVPAGEPL